MGRGGGGRGGGGGFGGGRGSGGFRRGGSGGKQLQSLSTRDGKSETNHKSSGDETLTRNAAAISASRSRGNSHFGGGHSESEATDDIRSDQEQQNMPRNMGIVGTSYKGGSLIQSPRLSNSMTYFPYGSF